MNRLQALIMWFNELRCNIQKCIFPPDKSYSGKYRYLMTFLCFSVMVGLAGLICYSFSKSSSVFGIAILLALASFGVGGVLGFIFGIPLHSQSETDSSKKSYKPNTNLERISEWLTTVLVGISLTQSQTIITYIKKYTVFASPGLGNQQAASQTLAFAILVCFSIPGFFTFYLWARLKLPDMFGEAENPSPKAINVKAISHSISYCFDALNALMGAKKEHFSALFDKEGDWRTLWSLIDQPPEPAQSSSKCMICAMYRHYGKDNGIVLAFGNDYLLDNNVEPEDQDTVKTKSPPTSLDFYPMNDLVHPYGMVFTNNEINVCKINFNGLEPNGNSLSYYKSQAMEAIFDGLLIVDNKKNKISISTGHQEKFSSKSLDSNHDLSDFKNFLSNYLGLKLSEIKTPIDDTKLKDVDILIVGDAQASFIQEEIIAVENFVSKGGSLLVFGNAKYFGQSNT